MTRGVFIGVDPGTKGAIAAVKGSRLVAVEDLPTTEAYGRAEVSPERLKTMVDHIGNQYGPVAGFAIEAVGGQTTDGGSRAFRFGSAFGIVWATLCLTLPASGRWRVRPATWKAIYSLGGGIESKVAARAVAAERWPDFSAAFKRVKDADRAEAALIAAWCEIAATG